MFPRLRRNVSYGFVVVAVVLAVVFVVAALR
jgi:hypothetical protein